MIFRKKKKVIAFDIGGTSIRCGVVKGGRILKLARCETPKTRKAFLDKICELAEDFMDKDIDGIGVGFPSPVRDGVVKNPPNVRLKNFDLEKYLEKKFGKRVEVANDVDCVALAELKLGIKKKNFFVIALGTGIGGGVVIDGELYHGGSGYGSELGHIIIKGKDFESLWKKTKKRIVREFGKDVLVRDLCTLVDGGWLMVDGRKIRGKVKAREILEEAADYLGEGIASVVSVLDSEVVVLGGGIRDSGKVFLKMVNRGVRENSFLPEKVKVIFGKVDEAGVLGAALLLDAPSGKEVKKSKAS
jgi:glucokinase